MADWERALVTGASSGIGAAMAAELASRGTALVLVARSVDRLEALAAELTDRHGVRVEVLAADLADPAGLARVEARLATTVEADEDVAVDLLVNNAGYGFNGAFGTTPVDDEEAEIRVNVIALMRLCHAAVGTMTAAGHGGILNVSSTASFQPGPNSANYAATKAYVTSFSQSLHEELKGAGITVTALCPGLTRTEFQDRGGYDVGVPGFLWQDAAEVARAGIDGVSAGRAVVVAGWHNKTMQVASRLAPLSVSRWASSQVFKVAR